MTTIACSTDFTDRQLFVHDRPAIDLVDTLRPISYVKFTPDFVTGGPGGERKTLSDEEYQDIADERQAEWDAITPFGEGWMGMGAHCKVRHPNVTTKWEPGTLETAFGTVEFERPVNEIHGWNDGGMSGLERQLFEDCYDGSGGVQRPSVNVPQISRYKRPEWVLRRIVPAFPEADLADADVLVTAWESLDATPAMIEQFIAGFGKKSLDDTVACFVSLAAELDSATTYCNKTVSSKYIDFPKGAPGKYMGEEAKDYNEFLHGTSWRHNCPNVIPKEIEAIYDESVTTADSPEFVLGTAYEQWFIRNHDIDFDDMDSEDILEPNEDKFASSSEFRYVQIGNDLGEDRWIKWQPRWFESLLKQCKTETSYVALKTLGSNMKAKQDQGRLTSAQAMVFWGTYKVRKQRLRARIKSDSPYVPALMDRVLAAPKEKVGYIGFWLADQQQGGKQSGIWEHAKAITADGWSLVKEAYWERKRKLAAENEGLFN